MNKEQKLKSEIEAKEKELKSLKSNKLWQCYHCNKKTKISSIVVYMPMFWNDDPYALGCYASRYGDYYIKCPKCDKVSRIMCDTTYNYKNPENPIINKVKSKDWLFINEHKDYFKKVESMEDKKLTKYLYGE